MNNINKALTVLFLFVGLQSHALAPDEISNDDIRFRLIRGLFSEDEIGRQQRHDFIEHYDNLSSHLRRLRVSLNVSTQYLEKFSNKLLSEHKEINSLSNEAEKIDKALPSTVFGMMRKLSVDYAFIALVEKDIKNPVEIGYLPWDVIEHLVLYQNALRNFNKFLIKRPENADALNQIFNDDFEVLGLNKITDIVKMDQNILFQENISKPYREQKNSCNKKELLAKLYRSFIDDCAHFLSIKENSLKQYHNFLFNQFFNDTHKLYNFPNFDTEIEEATELTRKIQKGISFHHEKLRNIHEKVSFKDFCGWDSSISAKVIQENNFDVTALDPLTYPICFCEQDQPFIGTRAQACSSLFEKYLGNVRRHGALGRDLAEYVGGTFVTNTEFEPTLQTIRHELSKNRPVIVFYARGHWVTVSKQLDNAHFVVFNNGIAEMIHLNDLKKTMDIRGKKYRYLKHLNASKYAVFSAMLPVIVFEIGKSLVSDDYFPESLFAADEILGIDGRHENFSNFNIITLNRE